eukprot:CAMPEP_0194338946 /NCGR_PEP_ID=MMETSP0171-20130528/81314_1 /TAXON_ID=218684 /ORGANISM="Corethron pennatum, Strain L29A3" /LENGTH=158 /DNA_ID=CAMNT_0039103281 /DNA_START=32 /DNA_END=505 /DNA_ORIENTATION=-
MTRPVPGKLHGTERADSGISVFYNTWGQYFHLHAHVRPMVAGPHVHVPLPRHVVLSDDRALVPHTTYPHPHEPRNHLMRVGRSAGVEGGPVLVEDKVSVVHRLEHGAGGHLGPHVPLYLFDVGIFQNVNSRSAYPRSHVDHPPVGATETGHVDQAPPA